MAKHPTYVVGYDGSLDELARAIGNMTYDKTAEFIGLLAADLHRQAHADLGRGRPKLAEEVSKAVSHLEESRKYIDLAWKICEPHMKK